MASKQNIIIHTNSPTAMALAKEELSGRATLLFQHAQYFDKPIDKIGQNKVDGVIVFGEHPEIVKAYEEVKIEVDVQPIPGAEELKPITRETIAEMRKAELIETLEAHGVENPEGKVDELREKLTAIMFTNIEPTE